MPVGPNKAGEFSVDLGAIAADPVEIRPVAGYGR
jgi:hypothetical protein